MAAHAAQGSVLLYAGDLGAASDAFDTALKLVPDHWNDDLLSQFGTHLGFACDGGAAAAWHMRGYPDRAVRHADRMAAGARAADHPFAVAMALWGRAVWLWVRGDAREAIDAAEHLCRIGSAHLLREWESFGYLFNGWGLIVTGQEAEGLRRLERAAAMTADADAGIHEPFVLSLLADAYGRLGRREEARQFITTALAATTRQGGGWCEPELHRLMGELARDEPEEAERSFRNAMRIASRNGAGLFELRSALALGHVWRTCGRADEAVEIVQGVYGRFTEGFGAPDLVAARRFLSLAG
jgi:tetratricopeptide (TPR) repeat protein